MKLITSCPICYSHEIADFNGRANARCSNCGSLERTRYMYLLLNRMGVLSPDKSVLHFAPEPGLFWQLGQLCRGYRAMDFITSQYKNWEPEVEFIDLCNIDDTLEGTFDLIIHNHVLEHIPCSVSRVVSQLRSRLNPGGIMLFSVPTRAGAKTTEDLGPALSAEDRKRLFGQWDHMRIFGELDVIEVLSGNENNPVSLVNTFDFLAPVELEMAAIPGVVASLSGHAIYRVDA